MGRRALADWQEHLRACLDDRGRLAAGLCQNGRHRRYCLRADVPLPSVRSERRGPRHGSALQAGVDSDIAGLFLRDDTDWKEVAKLAEASYRRLAPERLTRSPS